MKPHFAAIILAGIAGAQVALAQPATLAGHPIAWTEYVRSLWPVIIVVAGLIGTGLLLGLATRFPTVASFNSLKARVLALETHVPEHGARITRVEELCATSPTRLELQEDISSLSERMRGVETGLEGIDGRMATMNTYLHTLIERGLQK